MKLYLAPGGLDPNKASSHSQSESHELLRSTLASQSDTRGKSAVLRDSLGIDRPKAPDIGADCVDSLVQVPTIYA